VDLANQPVRAVLVFKRLGALSADDCKYSIYITGEFNATVIAHGSPGSSADVSGRIKINKGNLFLSKFAQGGGGRARIVEEQEENLYPLYIPTSISTDTNNYSFIPSTSNNMTISSANSVTNNFMPQQTINKMSKGTISSLIEKFIANQLVAEKVNQLFPFDDLVGSFWVRSITPIRDRVNR
jgi:hypothetical protein